MPLIQERFTEGQKVVYAHHIKGESAYFHIGSGSEKRARALKERSPIWRAHVDMRGGLSHVEVTILERYRCPARSRLREMELINLHQPITNEFGGTSIPPAILDGRPKGSSSRCVCGATDCYGAELAAREMKTDPL